MRNSAHIAILALLSSYSVSAAADEWVVRTDGSKSACVVQKSTVDATKYPTLLTTKPTLVEACKDAHARKAPEMVWDKGKECTTYTSESVVACASAGVPLE